MRMNHCSSSILEWQNKGEKIQLEEWVIRDQQEVLNHKEFKYELKQMSNRRFAWQETWLLRWQIQQKKKWEWQGRVFFSFLELFVVTEAPSLNLFVTSMFTAIVTLWVWQADNWIGLSKLFIHTKDFAVELDFCSIKDRRGQEGQVTHWVSGKEQL